MYSGGTTHKLTWVSPYGNTRNQISHTLINKKLRSSFRDIRVYTGADIAGHHYLLKNTIKLKLRKVPRNRQQRTRYDIEKLRNAEIKRLFCLKQSNRYQALEVEESKCAIADEASTSDWFKTGMEQGCNISGFLFLLTRD